VDELFLGRIARLYGLRNCRGIIAFAIENAMPSAKLRVEMRPSAESTALSLAMALSKSLPAE